MLPFMDGWSFAKGEPENFAPVSLPHDWLIADPQNLYESGIGWYRRELDADFLAEGQSLVLRFDGVYMDSTLYVNGHQAGQWKYGYTAFEHNITPWLHRGETNVLLLRVNYQAPNARWYTGAGIYRNVWLKTQNACHFLSDGILITTFQKNGEWQYKVTAEVEAGSRPYQLRHSLPGAAQCPQPWSPEHPQLYTLHSELWVDGSLCDTAETRFGFRSAAFDPERGFLLNGQSTKLKGVCLHHDLGGLGAAVYPDAIRRQLTLLKAMGVNALRTAHNPPAHVLMNLADEMGFLVMSELLDIWRHPKNTYDYARFFDEWIERDVAAWIRRDRNHPSVIMWSVGNEIYDTHADAQAGGETLRRLMALVSLHDPEGHAPATLCSNYMPWENTQKCADLVKIVGYNYAERLYAAHHQAHPDWVIYGSETCSTAQSRGVYHFPLRQSVLADDDLQCSALGNSATSWGAPSVEACLLADEQAPFSMGQFLWAGQDYLGEPTPYHTKNSYLGHIDTAGFPKDSYYVIQAAWTDYRTAPMIHLFPYWDFSPGQPIDVRICSNAPKVELFLNGESQGAQALAGSWLADWQIPYQPGVLRAVAYGQDGNVIAEAFRRSFGDTATLQVECETYGSLTFATITAADAEGNPVENANCRAQVAVENGTLLALDNGDATDYEPYQSSSRRLFSGKLLAIVQSHSGVPKIFATLDPSDIPVRKVELACQGYLFTARLFPPNATHQQLLWRLTDSAGIDSPLGSLVPAPDGQSATVLPKGDGELYVRCSPTNGREHPAFIAQLPLTVTGLGKPFGNPYQFVAGGLYTASNTPLTNGNERGVATLRDGESHVGFRDLDFGATGADSLTLWLFPLEKTPFTFEIWQGMPGEGGERLCAPRYNKGSVWNTYLEFPVQLPRRIKGIATLCLVFRQKVHIKGFQFSKHEKAFQPLAAADNDGLYGDSFSVCGGAVEGIGNNVTLVFKDMDFGPKGARSLSLCWRSPRAKNSVQLVFHSSEESRQMIELGAAPEYAEQIFPLPAPVTGPQTVSLIFLPGSQLDLARLQFLP